MSIFIYLDYKQYLIDFIKAKPQKGHGEVTRMAEAVGSNATLISQVLSNRRDFSLEQSHSLTKHLNLNELERRYFIQLVLYARAGSEDLKKFHLNEIEQIKQASENIKNRVKTDLDLNDSEKSYFVSTWKPSALFVLTGRKNGISLDELKQNFNLPELEIKEILSELEKMGVVQLEEGRYKTGFKRMHLPKNSNFLLRHHTNWRLRAIQDFDQHSSQNLNYTSVASISESDWPELKQMMLNLISEYAKKISASGAEKVVCLNLDLFTPTKVP